jgi:ribosomal protein S18 acetylase RimI-like enzyme
MQIQISPNLHLRLVQPQDHDRHFALMQRIYPPAFAYLWPDDGDWYINRTHGKAAFEADLATPNAPYYHVYFKEALIGIFRLKLDDPNPDFPQEASLKLDRIYLDDATRGHGVGTQLTDYAKAETLRLGKSNLWLERMDTNEATIGFYYKSGFTDGSQFRLPFELMCAEYRGMYRIWWKG